MYHQLKAAQGFLELGDPDSAWEELESIPAEDRSYPVVLRMRVEIYQAKSRWMEMAEIAQHLTEIEPAEPQHWIHRAWAERRHVGPETAESTLLRALEGFPEEPLIHYNLACYASKLGRLEEARTRLNNAISLDASYRELALEDEDLEGIW
jgi:Tfp pilus assembly protein PilF